MTVRYFAAARSAAGARQETVTAESVAGALTLLRDRHDARFGAVLGASSLLLDGCQVHEPEARLFADVELDVLPPFAGG